jgi:hypothetical protein
VDLLNANKIDIDSSSLDSFVDGEDVEEDDAEEENELEEINEDAFEEYESSRKKRMGNYTKIKGDTCLVLACSDVSIDAVAKSDQTGMRCWQHTEDKFLQAHSSGCYTGHSLVPISPRTVGCDQSML